MAWDEGRSQQRAFPWPDTEPSWPALPRHTSPCTAARRPSVLATTLNIFYPVEHIVLPNAPETKGMSAILPETEVQAEAEAEAEVADRRDDKCSTGGHLG